MMGEEVKARDSLGNGQWRADEFEAMEYMITYGEEIKDPRNEPSRTSKF